MLNRRRQISGLFSSGSWLRSQSGRVLSGLVLGVTSPQIADAARQGERRADNQDRKTDEARSNRDTSEERNQSEKESGQRTDDKSGTDNGNLSAKSNNSRKQDRTESTDESNESREQRATDDGKPRGESRRNSDSDSSERSAENDDSEPHSGWHVRRFEQRADSEPADDVADVTTVTPANPNVVIDDAPSSPIADLVVDANDDVLASVSTTGGFAFARSGDVIAVSGPDGASIVQTGDVDTGTSGTTPGEPSDDGGNNDVDFSS